MQETSPTTTTDVTKVKFQPLGDRLIVKPEEAASMTEGGLHIPDTAKERPQVGTIIAVGEGRHSEKEIVFKLNQILDKMGIEKLPVKYFEFKEGMKVLYGRYAGSEIDYAGQKVLIMRFDDVACIL